MVKRTISPETACIIEDVIQPARKPGQPASEFVTTICRKDTTTTTFDATDAGHTFNGTISFKGDEWNWNEWTYAIKLADGGRLEGQGKLTETGIFTDKLMSDKTSKPSVQIHEELLNISSEKYEQLRQQLLNNINLQIK